MSSSPKGLLLFVTGTRADWGKLEPLAKAAKDNGYYIDIFVTGMHMLEKYGNTKDQVDRLFDHGWDAGISEFNNHERGTDPTLVGIETMRGLLERINHQKPSALVVHGDRVEAHAACTVAAQQSVICLHIEGGEVSGSIDEQYRHASSIFSTYHFVSSDAAKLRLVNHLGQHPATVFPIGSPELDVHLAGFDVTIEEVKQKHEISFDDFGIVTFHSVVTEADQMSAQAQSLFEFLTESMKNFVVIMPNNDPGSDAIRDVITRLSTDRFRVLPSMPFKDFSVLMKGCKGVIGNSSAGVRELPFLGVPSLNVGTRQAGRAQGAPSITHVMADNKPEVDRFLAQEWGKRYARHEGFGRGQAAKEFVQVLMQDKFWDISLQKFMYEEA